MRTTIDLPDDLLQEAKQRAAHEGRSLSAVVADAVRRSFAQRRDRKGETVRLPTFDGGGFQPGVDLDDSADLLEIMERGG